MVIISGVPILEFLRYIYPCRVESLADSCNPSWSYCCHPYIGLSIGVGVTLLSFMTKFIILGASRAPDKKE